MGLLEKIVFSRLQCHYFRQEQTKILGWVTVQDTARKKGALSLEINGARCKAISVTRAWTKNSWDHNQSRREKAKADFQLCGAPRGEYWLLHMDAARARWGNWFPPVGLMPSTGHYQTLEDKRTLVKILILIKATFVHQRSNLCTLRSKCRRYMGVFPSCYLWWPPRLEVWNEKVKQEERSICKLIMGHWAEGQTQSCRQNHLECFHLFVWKLMIFLTFWHTSSLEMNWGNFHSPWHVLSK